MASLMRRMLGLEKRESAADRYPAGFNPRPAPLSEFYASGSIANEGVGVSAIQRAAGAWYAFAFQQATFERNHPALAGLSAQVLGGIAQALIVRGECILYPAEDFALIECPYAYIEGGNYNRSSWRYRISLPGPSVSVDRLVDSDAVLHFQWRPSYGEPWRSENPFASPAGQAVLRLEQALLADASAPTLQYLPIAQSVANRSVEDRAQRTNTADSRKTLQDAYSAALHNIRQADGGLITGPSWRGTSSRVGPLEASDAPALAGRDERNADRPIRWGVDIPPGMITAYDSVARSALSAVGIPGDLLLKSDAQGQKEGFREFYTAGVQGMAAIIADEIRAKLAPVVFSFDKLLASDVQARSRAYAQFLAGGMPSEAALKLVGLEGDGTR